MKNYIMKETDRLGKIWTACVIALVPVGVLIALGAGRLMYKKGWI